jgi:hypothetical protein
VSIWRLDMAKVTLYQSGNRQDYPNAHDIVISSAGVLTFYWEASEEGGSRRARAYKFVASAPFVVEEEIAAS